mgnify:FL=1
MNSIANFLKDVKLELGRVNWPTRQQTTRHTVAVIILSLVIAAFLGGLDFVFTYVLNKFIL